jgi:hypothetical protein
VEVYVARHGKPDVRFAEAEQSNAVRIRMPDGVVFSLRQNREGGLDVTESTHRHLVVAPRAANAVELMGTTPESFQVRPNDGYARVGRDQE